ncbi:LPS-assembly protein LptD [uncultured Lamprocystis sp.]|uniref:LPS-assembly protein LptD n=3 Tax=uncultured Lamprocystis sp. TaxID=543132 RepID=UPI0025EA8A3E|nr:LPS-assembly protein LptD [uncultured Lamprocystis sp.]
MSQPPEPARLTLPIVLDPARPVFTGIAPLVLPPPDQPSTAADTARMNAALGPQPKVVTRDAEARLHAGLPWERCGPPGRGTGGGAAPAANPNVPVDATADQADYDQTGGVVRLQGDVEILQGDQRLEADRSRYHRRTGAVDAQGNVYLEYPPARLTADSADYNLRTKEGTLQNVHYRLSGDANLRGTAATADLLPGQITRYREVTYTTCPPGRYDWSIHARSLLLDHPEGLGTARHARLQFGNLPVFYTPYMTFPIDDRRRSGLLIPTVGSSDTTGTDIILPYYWNIAPNLDATITPRFMSTRGLMLGAQVRHLTSNQKTEINGEILPHDAADPDLGTRGALRLEQTGTLGGRWGTSIDYAMVSDDQYLADFGNSLDVTSVRNLVQRGNLSYNGGTYSVQAWLQGFQTVDPTISPANRPYGQLPHIQVDVPRTRWGLLEYAFEGRYDYFDHHAKVHGNRGVLLPSLRLPLRRSFGHLIPRVRLYATGYDLADTQPGTASVQSFLIPSFDMDAGLVFERDLNWFGQGALQTLEPRFYYVATPYENQSDTPLFDTTLLDFSYASLFKPNRFTGYDRVGDENRFTIGLTSRTLGNKSGREWLRASLGQVYYFDKRRVQLTGVSADETTTSSVAGELSTNPAPGWNARASFQWDPNLSSNQWEKRVVQFRYAPGDDRVFNFAYRYNLGQTEPERYENTDLSFRLPLTPQISLVGRWLYSLLDSDTVDAFAGIEFGRCCWRLRILARHLKTTAESEGNTSVMLQLELAGLGSLGNKIDKLLEHGIYGYDSD